MTVAPVRKETVEEQQQLFRDLTNAREYGLAERGVLTAGLTLDADGRFTIDAFGRKAVIDGPNLTDFHLICWSYALHEWLREHCRPDGLVYVSPTEVARTLYEHHNGEKVARVRQAFYDLFEAEVSFHAYDATIGKERKRDRARLLGQAIATPELQEQLDLGTPEAYGALRGRKTLQLELPHWVREQVVRKYVGRVHYRHAIAMGRSPRAVRMYLHLAGRDFNAIDGDPNSEEALIPLSAAALQHFMVDPSAEPSEQNQALRRAGEVLVRRGLYLRADVLPSTDIFEAGTAPPDAPYTLVARRPSAPLDIDHLMPAQDAA